MSNGIDLKGVSEVLAQFDFRETPFFYVYQGKDLKFFNAEDDIEAARNMLDVTLKTLEKNGSTAPFKIVWYGKLNTDKDEVDKNSMLGSNTFRVVPVGMGMQKYWALQNGDISAEQVAMSGYNGGNYGNAKIMEVLTGIDSRLTAMENPLSVDDDDDEQPEPETNQSKLLGALAGIVSHPDVQQLLANKLIGLLNLIPSGAAVGGSQSFNNNSQPNNGNMNDINTNLQILFSAGMTENDIAKLANIAQTNPAQFSMLLNMLRQ
jgi:hypothetical protein